MVRNILLTVLLAALGFTLGCEVNPNDSNPDENYKAEAQQALANQTAQNNQPQENTQPAENTTPVQTVAGSDAQVPADFAGVVWLHENVSGWAQTSSLNVSIGGGSITLNYDKAKVWPARNGVNANPWVFVFRDGRWYAATFEWLRFGQTTKPTSTVRGDHIKKPPLNNFHPVSGEVYGFMVSGLARDNSTRNVRERTNVVMMRWP